MNEFASWIIVFVCLSYCFVKIYSRNNIDTRLAQTTCHAAASTKEINGFQLRLAVFVCYIFNGSCFHNNSILIFATFSPKLPLKLPPNTIVSHLSHQKLEALVLQGCERTRKSVWNDDIYQLGYI